jgi:hypothetical protein
VVADRTRAAVDRWLHARTRDWLARIATVALDPWRGYAGALVAPLGHATVVVDHFRIRKLLLTAAEQLTSQGRVRLRAGLAVGDPTGEVAAALAGQGCCAPVYAASDLAHAPGRAGTLVPLGRRRRGGRAVEACPRRQSLGSRDPRLACHQWLFQRADRGRESTHQEGQARRTAQHALEPGPGMPATAEG